MNSDLQSMSALPERRQVRRAAAFTLVELIAVLALVAVLSIASIPAIGAMTKARQSAAAGEAMRFFTVARQRAMATGEPTGVAVDLASQTLTMLRIAEGGGSPAPALQGVGAGAYELRVSAKYAGAAIESVQSATSVGVVIWFRSDGSPAARQGDGSFVALAHDASLRFTGGAIVTVRRGTGAVER